MAGEKSILHFFLIRPAEISDGFACLVIVSVRIYQKSGFFHIECSRFRVDVCGIGENAFYIGYEHIVATQMQDFSHFAFDAQGRFFDIGGGDFSGSDRGESAFGKFVIVFAERTPHQSVVRANPSVVRLMTKAILRSTIAWE